MGHMDVEKFTVTIYHAEESEVYHGCTDVNTSVDQTISFDDNNSKRQEFHGVSYHVAQE